MAHVGGKRGMIEKAKGMMSRGQASVVGSGWGWCWRFLGGMGIAVNDVMGQTL